MTDPIMLAIAGAVAGKTTEVALESGRKAIGALRDLVKRRFVSEPSAQAALEAAQRSPDDEQIQAQLAMALQMVAAADREFDQRLRQEWEQAQTVISAGPGSTVNSVSGTVYGDVNQIGPNDGGITINHYR